MRKTQLLSLSHFQRAFPFNFSFLFLFELLLNLHWLLKVGFETFLSWCWAVNKTHCRAAMLGSNRETANDLSHLRKASSKRTVGANGASRLGVKDVVRVEVVMATSSKVKKDPVILEYHASHRIGALLRQVEKVCTLFFHLCFVTFYYVFFNSVFPVCWLQVPSSPLRSFVVLFLLFFLSPFLL